MVKEFNFIKNLRLKKVASSQDIPVCNTRVIRGGHGMVWDKKIAVHPLHDGTLEITEVP